MKKSRGADSPVGRWVRNISNCWRCINIIVRKCIQKRVKYFIFCNAINVEISLWSVASNFVFIFRCHKRSNRWSHKVASRALLVLVENYLWLMKTLENYMHFQSKLEFVMKFIQLPWASHNIKILWKSNIQKNDLSWFVFKKTLQMRYSMCLEN